MTVHKDEVISERLLPKMQFTKQMTFSVYKPLNKFVVNRTEGIKDIVTSERLITKN